MADLTFNVLGLAYDVQGLTSEVPGLRPGQTRPNLSPDDEVEPSENCRLASRCQNNVWNLLFCF